MTHTATHTPGPWKAVRDEARNPHYAWNIEGAPGVVPTIARLSMIDAGAQIEPNAHLIAAAPAMYEALQQLVKVEQLRTQATLDNDYVDIVLADQQLQTLAQAALAQAEGKQ